MGLKQTAAPATPVVTVQEVKPHCGIDPDITADDLLLGVYVRSATSQVERRTGRQLITATWQLTLPGVPTSRCVRLPRPPLVAVTGITYLDTAGVTQTLGTSNYRTYGAADIHNAGGVYIHTPPTDIHIDHPEALTITFICGYGNGEDVPDMLRAAIMILVAGSYRDREPTTDSAVNLLPYGVDALLQPYLYREGY